MKSRFWGVGLGSTIFIFLTIAVIALVRPVYLRMSSAISELEKNVCVQLEEKTGLSVSYKSLSPALFVAANFKIIELKDAATGKTVLNIRKLTLSYSVSQFFSGNPLLALKKLTLNGVKVEYDAVKDFSFVEKIKKLMDEEKSGENFDTASKETSEAVSDKAPEKNPETVEEKSDVEFSLKGRTVNIPLDIVVKNLSVHYSDKNNDLLFFINKLSVQDFERSDAISLKASGKINAASTYIPGTKKMGTFSVGFSLSGNLLPELDGTSVLLSLNGQGGADYSISHLDMLLNYSQDIFELRTMRTVLPFSLFARCDINKETLELKSEFDHFDPFRLVSIRRKNETLQKISGSTLTGNLSGILSPQDIVYKSDLTFGLSRKLFGSPVNFKVAVEGDKKYASIRKIAASGEFIDAEYTGGFNISTLQPSGTLSLNYLRLNNGGIISTEVYVDPSRNGFMCFAPQLFFDDKSFTAVQFSAYPGTKSVDFAFEFFDYAHADYESSGHFLMEGSLLTSQGAYLQASVAVSDLFLDSVAQTAAFFGNPDFKEMVNGASKALEPYVFNTELYISSDLKDFSVNAPTCLLANTKKDRELLVFAADGSKETLNISQLDLQFGNLEAHANTSVDFANGIREFSFLSDLTVNSIPYNFSGNVTPEWISVAGDYDFDAVISIHDSQNLSGTVSCSQFPIALGKNVFALSYDISMNWNKFEGPSAEIFSFEVSEPSLNLSFAPHLAFSGSVNRHGFMLNEFAYSDNSSTLDGNGSLIWNMNDGIFDSIHMKLEGSSYISSETLSINVDFTNPSQKPLTAEAFMNDFYMSVAASVHNFPSSRLMDSQTKADVISADLTATGTISNPFVSVILNNASLSLYGYPFMANAAVVYDDTGLSVKDLNCSWSMLKVKNFNAGFDISNFEASAQSDIEVNLSGKRIEAPVKIELRGEKEKSGFEIPDFFSVELVSEKIGGNFFNDSFPFKVAAYKSPGRFDIVSGDGTSFAASYDSDGIVRAKADSSVVKFDLAGTIINNEMNLEVKGINADFKKISSQVEIPAVHFNSGILSGALRITGLTTDPEFTGAFSFAHPNLLIPFISKSAFSADKLFMTVGQGEARVEPSQVFLGKGYGMVGMVMEFNRWGIDSILCTVDVDDAHKVPVEMAYPYVYIKGDGSCSLKILYNNPSELSVTGWVVGDNTDVDFVTAKWQNQFTLDDIGESVPTAPSDDGSSFKLFVDLDITVGQKVQVLFNPLLRGVAKPGTPIKIYIDDNEGEFIYKSDIELRGGEMVWLNRNFYMKEGRITLNENQDKFDPMITVRAETRERDENGNLVTIVLSAINQSFSSFNPLFSSIPAKSEQEIMVLLGQVVSADSENFGSVVVAGGDYLMQATVMRRVENTLREMLNFDIFSIRTNVLQNSLKVTMDKSYEKKQITIGNFIDNSTVYIGKYFGSSMYVDSLLHWTYDENKDDDGTAVNAIVFQPEFGFEMTSPYVNIRLGVAPDIEAIKKGDNGMWVPATSMTLSWKHSF